VNLKLKTFIACSALFPALTVANDLSQSQRDQICQQMMSSEGLVATTITRKSSIGIQGIKPRHVLQNVEATFKGEDPKYFKCELDSNVWSVIVSCVKSLFDDPYARYNFYRTASSRYIIGDITSTDINNMYPVNSGGDTDRSKETTFTQRGAYAVGMLQKLDSSPFYCDESAVYSQVAPTIALKTYQDFIPPYQPISAEVNYSYDELYSYVAVRGTPPQFTWTFENMDYSGVKEVWSTNVPSVSFHPQYSGEYKVTAKISDGTFSASTLIGYVMYASSNNECPPSAGSGCQQPF